MKNKLIIALTLLSLITLYSCGKDDTAGSTNTFSLQGSGS